MVKKKRFGSKVLESDPDLQKSGVDFHGGLAVQYMIHTTRCRGGDESKLTVSQVGPQTSSPWMAVDLGRKDQVIDAERRTQPTTYIVITITGTPVHLLSCLGICFICTA